MITVWRLVSPSTGQTVLSIQPMRVDDYKYQHEYQTIVYRGHRSDWKGVTA